MPIYIEQTRGLSHETKGIRRSEMFFFYASVAALNPARIVESGRARAQSTLVLARLFPRALVVSLESDSLSPDARVAAERLREYRNVECRFGDSLLLLPELLQAGDVVLIDGPKDFRALKLAFRLLRRGQPTAVFVHDLWLVLARIVDRYVPRRNWVMNRRRLNASVLDGSWRAASRMTCARLRRNPLCFGTGLASLILFQSSGAKCRSHPRNRP